jgi:hypothetical protein
VTEWWHFETEAATQEEAERIAMQAGKEHWEIEYATQETTTYDEEA